MDIKNRVIIKLKERYSFDDSAAERNATDLIDKCKRVNITRNLEEWLDGITPYSDIHIGDTGYSIRMIMAICPGRDFRTSVDIAYRLLFGDRDLAEREIWTVRR